MNNSELVEADAVDTRVGRAILIKGEIEGDGNVVVEGRVEGNIAIKGDLHIAIEGQVKSSVSARNIFVQGILVGSASAAEKIELAQGGRMIGDVRAPRFLINEGAAYKGTVDMVDFETEEERSGESQRTTRQSGTARPQAAKTVRPPSLDPRRESFSRPLIAKSSSSTPEKPAGSSVYTPPPMPRPPEFVGIKKAIIVKKKSSEGE